MAQKSLKTVLFAAKNEKVSFLEAVEIFRRFVFGGKTIDFRP